MIIIGKFGGHDDLELATARHQVVRAWGAHAASLMPNRPITECQSPPDPPAKQSALLSVGQKCLCPNFAL